MHALDRAQRRCQLLFISIDSFVHLEAKGDTSAPSPVLIWEESRDIWINVREMRGRGRERERERKGGREIGWRKIFLVQEH